MEKYGLSLQKRGFFDRLPRRPKSKFSKKEKYIPTELSPLSEKLKSLCIGLKLVEISCPKVLRTDTHTQTDRHSQILAQLKLRITLIVCIKYLLENYNVQNLLFVLLYLGV